MDEWKGKLNVWTKLKTRVWVMAKLKRKMGLILLGLRVRGQEVPPQRKNSIQ